MKDTKYSYEAPTVTPLGSVEQLTGWITVGTRFDNPFTNHRRF